MSVERENANGHWLPAEPEPEAFGIVWRRLWHARRASGERKWFALFTSWRDTRELSRLSA